MPQLRPELYPYLDTLLKEMRGILVDRGASYADLEDNTSAWAQMAQIMGIYQGGEMDPNTWAATQYILAKLSRLSQNPTHEDSWIDIANYAILVLAMQRRRRDMQFPVPQAVPEPAPSGRVGIMEPPAIPTERNIRGEDVRKDHIWG